MTLQAPKFFRWQKNSILLSPSYFGLWSLWLEYFRRSLCHLSRLDPFDLDEHLYQSKKLFLKKTPIEVDSSHLYASFGTFCVQIGQFLEALWVFEKYLKTVKSLFLKENDVDFEFFRKVKISLNNRPIWTQKVPKDLSYKHL